jgi:hypothetical protein
MHRHARHISENQIPLDLEPTASPTGESAQRAAYKRLKLSRYLTFEQVMSNRALAIGIRNLAHAIALRVFAGRTTRAHANQ